MLDTIAEEFSGTFAAVPPGVAAVRLTIAILLGGLIGLEREVAGRPARLRTHMLIALAACLFILVSQELSHVGFAGQADIRLDPLRLVEAVTSGVAFLAAGTVVMSGGKVRNLTTGASMWLAGAVGLACGAGRMPLATIAVVLSLLILLLVSRLEKRAPGMKKPDHLKGE